jgi:hypothetical protein
MPTTRANGSAAFAVVTSPRTIWDVRAERWLAHARRGGHTDWKAATSVAPVEISWYELAMR